MRIVLEQSPLTFPMMRVVCLEAWDQKTSVAGTPLARASASVVSRAPDRSLSACSC